MMHSLQRTSTRPLARYESRYAELRPRVVLVGDSTVCEQPLDSNYRGWGQYLAAALGEQVQVSNFAKSGASTKTFIGEGLWDKVLAQRADWVLIQMGHNDSHAPEKPESTRADGEYAANLRRFVQELRTIGSRPVLITPVNRFRFLANGKIADSPESLAPYAWQMKAIGCELQVPVVDLFASSTRFFEQLGPGKANQLSSQPGKDFTHFNEDGARAIVALVVEELLVAAPILGRASHQEPRVLAVSQPYPS